VAGGSDKQFTTLTILQALVRARNRFVLDALIPPTNSIANVSAGSGLCLISQYLSNIRRLVWADNTPGQPSTRYPLVRTDVRSMASFDRTSSRPIAYSQSETTPGQVQLYPPPANPGTLDYIADVSVAHWAPGLIDSTTLVIPDDYTPAIKYAAMSDLLATDSDRTNPMLSKYCELRYQWMVEFAKLSRCVVGALVNGRRVQVIAPTQLDRIKPLWMNSPGNPVYCAAYYDMVAFGPIPRPGKTYSATLEVIRSAPIPSALGDYIQVGQDLIPSLIDYAQHYLSLKLGGADFTQTFHTFNSFQTMLSNRNNLLGGRIRHLTEITTASRTDQNYTPNESNVPNVIRQLEDK
jgi:hypothetical protein